MRKQQTISIDAIISLVRLRRKSSLSDLEWCRKNSVSVSTFYEWVHILRLKDIYNLTEPTRDDAELSHVLFVTVFKGVQIKVQQGVSKEIFYFIKDFIKINKNETADSCDSND